MEKQFANGLNFLATYTFSKTDTDAGDLLNGGSTAKAIRAPDVPGAGIHFDYGLAHFDIRNVFHFSGGYELPFGKGKRYMADGGGLRTLLLEDGASTGAPPCRVANRLRLPCPTGTAAGTGCYDLLVKGQSPKLGLHTDANGS